ncbi:MAG: nicotinate-nicotinamide nucleotide adenylyltransferase [Alphaproteobacteria bacterium]|nr:nicotinate-nicotinamide nucleotide adenylyltransferase [Alphaproteobacteria bacterium]
MRIGLLGGSFDPAHGGHLYVSEIAKKALKLDYVWWLVSPGNPLKPAPDALAVRLKRARLLARDKRIIVTGIEQRLGTRYTIDSVMALKRRFPHVAFTWLMGSDNLEQFSRWRRWQNIAAALPIVVVRRPGSVLASLHAPLARRLGLARRPSPAPSLLALDGPRSLESSTELRSRALGAAAEAMLNLTP